MLDVATDVDTLVRDGIVGRRSAFPATWVEQMRADLDAAFAAARSIDGGAVQRGPERWYVEIVPEQLDGFVELASHTWVTAISEAVLGPDYEIVELGFDVSFPGSADQPWHRDFPSTPETYEERRITSLAFNMTAVDIDEDLGPMVVAPGTHWERGEEFEDGMFPPKAEASRYAAAAVPKYAKVGDISARSALTIHRGTANRGNTARPVLVLGVDAPGAGHAALHAMAVTPEYHAALPAVVRDHLNTRVVDALEPIVQKHQIDRLNTDYG